MKKLCKDCATYDILMSQVGTEFNGDNELLIVEKGECDNCSKSKVYTVALKTDTQTGVKCDTLNGVTINDIIDHLQENNDNVVSVVLSREIK